MSSQLKKKRKRNNDATHRRCDPAAKLLDSDVMAHIFSFLGGGHGKFFFKANSAPRLVRRRAPVQLVRLDQACRLVAYLNKIGLVSKAWHDVIASRLSSILGPIDGYFPILSNNHRQVNKRMRWIIQNRLRMGSILIYSSHDDIHENLVLTRLQASDTTDLERLAVNIDPTAEQQIQLYDIIADKCPNLKELAISMHHPIDMYHPLFRMPSIQWMHIYLSGRVFFEDLPVCNLPALTELRLSGGRPFEEHCPCLLKIGSDSLKILNLEGLNSHVFVQCECPRLESFSCNPTSGSFPIRERNNMMEHDLPPFARTTAGKEPFWKLDVPPSCRIAVEGHLSRRHRYEIEILERQKQFLKVRFPKEQFPQDEEHISKDKKDAADDR